MQGLATQSRCNGYRIRLAGMYRATRIKFTLIFRLPPLVKESVLCRTQKIGLCLHPVDGHRSLLRGERIRLHSEKGKGKIASNFS